MSNIKLKKALFVLEVMNFSSEERKAIEIGKTEEKIAMVKSVLRVGVSVDVIVEVSVLTRQQIQNL